MELPTRAEFVKVLRQVSMPRGRQLDFLREHVQSPGRALTARRLARAVGYQSYGGINLQYGLLARRIGDALARSNVNLSLLV